MNIEQQKEIAKSVYSKLKIIDPHCLLAGGAPRDWYLGKECNDLDFYYVSTATTVSSCRKQLERTFEGAEIKTISEIHGDGSREMIGLYKKMPDLVRVWQMNIEGMNVQLVQLATPGSQFKVVGCMDVSICKIWADVNLKLYPSTEFKKTIASKSMFLSEGYSWSDTHPQKMKQRFEKLFSCASSEASVDKTIIHMVLKEGGF